MRDFVALGFNEDADAASQGSGRRSGRRVVDGVLNWVGGASGVFLNTRSAPIGSISPDGILSFNSRSRIRLRRIL